MAHVDDPFAAGVGDPSLPNVPLERDGPVKSLAAGRHLDDLKRHNVLESRKCFSQTIPCNAPAYRVQLRSEPMHLDAKLLRTRARGGPPRVIHRASPHRRPEVDCPVRTSMRAVVA